MKFTNGAPAGWDETLDLQDSSGDDRSILKGIKDAGLLNINKYLNTFNAVDANDKFIINITPDRISKYGLISKPDDEWLAHKKAQMQRGQERVEEYEKSVHDNLGTIGGTVATMVVDPANAIPVGKLASKLLPKMLMLGGLNAGIEAAQVAGDNRLTTGQKVGSTALAGVVGGAFGAGQHAVGKLWSKRRAPATSQTSNVSDESIAKSITDAIEPGVQEQPLALTTRVGEVPDPNAPIAIPGEVKPTRDEVIRNLRETYAVGADPNLPAEPQTTPNIAAKERFPLSDYEVDPDNVPPYLLKQSSGNSSGAAAVADDFDITYKRNPAEPDNTLHAARELTPEQTAKIDISNSRVTGEVENLSQQIDDVFSGKINTQAPIIVGETPEVMQMLGVKKLPMHLGQVKLIEGITGEHNIDREIVKQMPRLLSRPVAVFKSRTVDNSYVVLTDAVNSKGNPVVAALHIEVKNQNIDVNYIASIYAKDDIMSWLKNNINDRLVRYVDKEKATRLLNTYRAPIARGHQLSSGLTYSDLMRGGKGKILLESDLVNYITKDTPDIKHMNLGINPLSPEFGKAAGGLGEKISTAVRNISDKSDLVDAFTNSRLTRNKPYNAARERMNASMPKLMNEIEVIAKAMGGLSEQVRNNLHRYISGDIDGAALTPNVKKLGDALNRRITELGQRAVDEGTLTQEAFDTWKGQYLHRTYQKPAQKSAIDALAKLKGRYNTPVNHQRGKTWEVSAAQYQKHLNAGEIGSVAKGKIEAEKLANGRYKLRQDYTPAERAKMGEITDAAFTVPDTIHRLNQMINHGRFLKEVSTLTDSVIPEASIKKGQTVPEGYRQVRGAQWGALDGSYVKKEIINDIKGLTGTLLGDNPIAKAWLGYLSLWKKAVVVYNPGSHWNNTVSNYTLLLGDGLNPPTIHKIVRGAVNDIKTMNKLKELQAKNLNGTLTALETKEFNRILKAIQTGELRYAQEAINTGMLGRTQLKDIILVNNLNNPQQIGMKGLLNKSAKWAERLYQGEDNMFRLGYYTYLRKIGKGADEARRVVGDLFPDYTKPMSKAAMLARDTGLIPFISWTYHTLPGILRQFKVWEKTPNGKSRAARVLVLFAAYNAAYRAQGINPLEELPGGYGGGKRVPLPGMGWLKIDRMVPHINYLPWNLPETIRADFLSGGYPVQVFGAINNWNPYFQDKITYREGAAGAYDRAKFALGLAPIPGVVKSAGGVVESLLAPPKKRTKTPWIPARTPRQSLQRLLGINESNLDIDAWRKHLKDQDIKEIKKRLGVK